MILETSANIGDNAHGHVIETIQLFIRGDPMKLRLPNGAPLERKMSYAVVA